MMRACFACVCGWVVMAGSASAGPVTIVSQDRSVRATAAVELNGLTDNKDNSVAAPPIIDRFNGTAFADARVDDPVSGQTMKVSSSASMVSDLTDSRISFIGSLITSASLTGLENVQSFHINDASAGARGTVGFRLDQNSTVTPTLNFTGGSVSRSNSSFNFDVLQNGSVIFDLRNPAPFALDAGDYQLDFGFDVGASNSADFDAKNIGYTVAVDFSAGAVGVPLPPALGAAGATVGLVGLLRVARRGRVLQVTW